MRTFFALLDALIRGSWLVDQYEEFIPPMRMPARSELNTRRQQALDDGTLLDTLVRGPSAWGGTTFGVWPAPPRNLSRGGAMPGRQQIRRHGPLLLQSQQWDRPGGRMSRFSCCEERSLSGL